MTKEEIMREKDDQIVYLMADMDTGKELMYLATEAMQSPEQQDMMLQYLHELQESGKQLTKQDLLTAIVIIHHESPASIE